MPAIVALLVWNDRVYYRVAVALGGSGISACGHERGLPDDPCPDSFWVGCT